MEIIKRHYEDTPAEGRYLLDINKDFDTTVRISLHEKFYLMQAMKLYLKTLTDDADNYTEEIKIIEQMLALLSEKPR